jgi:hypothetical protein
LGLAPRSRFESEGTSEFSALHRACDMLRSSSRPDDATSTSQRGKL